MKRILLQAICSSAMLVARDHRKPLDEAPEKEKSRTNPYDRALEAQQVGQKLYNRECKSCHGTHGEGSRYAPALAPSMEQAHPGAIFWVLRNGSLWRGMPSFSHLPESQRWQIIAYLKSMR